MTLRLLAPMLVGICILAIAGCGGGKAGGDKPALVDGDPPMAEHAHEGPHGGFIIDLGKGEYHAELTHDDDTKAVEIYLLDTSGKNSAPTDEKSVIINLLLAGKPLQFELPAAPLPDDPQGQSSHFKLENENLCDGWDAEGVKARLNVTIGGKTFSSGIEAHAHGGPGHKH